MSVKELTASTNFYNVQERLDKIYYDISLQGSNFRKLEGTRMKNRLRALQLTENALVGRKYLEQESETSSYVEKEDYRSSHTV